MTDGWAPPSASRQAAWGREHTCLTHLGSSLPSEVVPFPEAGPRRWEKSRRWTSGLTWQPAEPGAKPAFPEIKWRHCQSLLSEPETQPRRPCPGSSARALISDRAQHITPQEFGARIWLRHSWGKFQPHTSESERSEWAAELCRSGTISRPPGHRGARADRRGAHLHHLATGSGGEGSLGLSGLHPRWVALGRSLRLPGV